MRKAAQVVIAAAALAATFLPATDCRAQAPTLSGDDIYQEIHAGYAADAHYSGMLAALTLAHGKVADAADDPRWGRTTEQQLLQTLHEGPAGERLDIRSVVCRRTGCEVQFFETDPSTKPNDRPAWLQAVESLKLSDLGATIEMDANFFWKSGSSVMYVMTFRRKPESDIVSRQ